MASVSSPFSHLLLVPKTTTTPHPPARWSVRLPARVPSSLSLTRRRFPRFSSSSVQENGTGAVQGEEEKGEETTKDYDNDTAKVNEEAATASRVAEELKAAMAMRKAEREKNEAGDLIGGVAEEIREIEWPSFGKVVGTTGVVMAVIAGSSVALLTVNAVLAELSDRVFAVCVNKLSPKKIHLSKPISFRECFPGEAIRMMKANTMLYGAFNKAVNLFATWRWEVQGSCIK